MKCEVVPSEVSRIIPLSSSASSHLLDDGRHTFSIISKNGLWLYLMQDTVINVYHTESGKWCGGHCFGESLNNPSARISAAVEFTSSHISFPCLLLAVNQDHESLLCMFDVNSCSVLRSVLIPSRVTSLDVVSGNGGACVETHYLNHKLRYMFGIVAVGTLHGHLFFLDLCLDENVFCDERLPNITSVVKKKDFTAEKREIAISKKQHIFLHLNDESTSGKSFEFKSRCNTLGRFPNGDVYVTAMKFIQSLSTLAVGFNFGGIQLWDLHCLSLQYTLSDHHDQAIVNFAFQEPENDPRHFCYLWVVKGHTTGEEELPDTISVATLYSLTYHKRSYVENFGALYTDLQSCNKRFEFPLCNEPCSSFRMNPVGTRVISCQVISQKDVHHLFDTASPNESDSVSEDMSLCFLSWEVWPESEHLLPTFHMAVFDLNQWYQAHMPFSFRGSPNELNPYLGVFSVEEFGRNFIENGILGFYAVPQSVKKFKSLTSSEEFFYPSSLGFQLLCFTGSGLRKASYFGLQKHLLYQIADLGPQVLLNPKEIYPSLIKSGLVADLHGGADRTSLTAQKETLLQLALEHNLPFFFMKCLKEWRYTDSMHEFCTSKALLSWAWKKVIAIKNSIDKICVPLFNCSGEDVDKASLKYLYNFRRQLNLIDRIMAGYQKYVTPRTEQGIQELQCRRDAVSSINMYLQVVLWLRSAHILPENACSGDSEKITRYDYNVACKSYVTKRIRLNKLHRLVDPNDVLLIDGLVKEAGISTSWQEKNGTGMFPPPSVYAAVSCYLLGGISIQLKHSLMYYFLLDIKNRNGTKVLLRELKKFPIIFGMPQSLVKQLKGFWYLDAQETGFALQKLLHQSIKTSDILPWQHQRIIKSFLFWKSPESALKYINHMEPPQQTMEDMKLHLSILLACGAITRAYEYQRKKQQEGYGSELLNHFFLGCQEMHKMKDLMSLPLNSLESSGLVRFLSESRVPQAQEFLVMYHLLHCNFFEAAKVNEKLSAFLLDKGPAFKQAPISKRTKHRDDLVTNLMTAVPKSEKCLFEEMKRFPSEASRKDDVPVICAPLSFKCGGSFPNQITYSDIVRTIISKDSPCTVKRDLSFNFKSRNSYLEDLPFLRPPVTPETVKQPSLVGNSNSAVAKRSFVASPTEYSSPAKRSRLLDNVPFMSTPASAKKTPKHLAGDIASLLQTPPIPMRLPGSESGSAVKTSAVKPQSILKKKAKPLHMQLNFLTASTPSCSEAESSDDEPMVVEDLSEWKDSLICDWKETENNSKAENVPIDNVVSDDQNVIAESPSRQIRFDLPVKEQNVRELSPYPDLLTQEQALQQSLLSELSNKEICAAASLASRSISDMHTALTREPLRRQEEEKKILDIVEETSISSAETAMEVEKSKYSGVTPRREENISEMISENLASDSGIATTTISNSTLFRFTAPVLPDGGSALRSRSVNQSFQNRSLTVTPRPPLRDENKSFSENRRDTDACTTEQAHLNVLSFSSPKKTETSLVASNTSQATPNSVSLDQSDADSFYSPCADMSGFPKSSSMPLEPVNLFPIEPSTEVQKTETNIAAVLQGFGSKPQQDFDNNYVDSPENRDSEGSDDTILISSDTSNDDIDAAVSFLHESSSRSKSLVPGAESMRDGEFPIEEDTLKITHEATTFRKDITDKTKDSKGSLEVSHVHNKGSKSDADSESMLQSEVSIHVTNEAFDSSMHRDFGTKSFKVPDFSLFGNVSKASRKTFVFTKNVQSNETKTSKDTLDSSEIHAKDQKPDEEWENPPHPDASMDLPVEASSSSKLGDLTSESFKVSDISLFGNTSRTKPSRKTFVFVKNVRSSGVNYSKGDLETSEPRNKDEKPGKSVESNSQQTVTMNIPEASDETKIKGETYTKDEKFAKSIESDSPQDMAMDVPEASDDTKIKDPSTESFKVPDFSFFDKSTVSRKTFVFTKSMRSSGVNYSKDDIQDSGLPSKSSFQDEPSEMQSIVIEPQTEIPEPSDSESKTVPAPDSVTKTDEGINIQSSVTKTTETENTFTESKTTTEDMEIQLSVAETTESKVLERESSILKPVSSEQSVAGAEVEKNMDDISMNVTDIQDPKKLLSGLKKGTRTSRKTFVFTKNASSIETSVMEDKSQLSTADVSTSRNPQSSDSQQSADAGFFSKLSVAETTDSKVLERENYILKPVSSEQSVAGAEVEKNMDDISMKVTDIQDPKKLLSGVKKGTRTSRKTFVFTKNASSKETSVMEDKSQLSTADVSTSRNPQSSESQQSADAGFFSKMEDETYETFSSSLKQSTSDAPENTTNKNLVSSPTVENSLLNTTKEKESSSKSKAISKKKVRKSTAVGTTPGLARRKKSKAKTPEKIEFSFSEPHSPADSEILKALAQSPETPTPLPSFMFSPPLTRGRLKKKRMDDTLGSSFSSMASEASFVRSHSPPPVDPILEGIIMEKNLGTKRKSRGRPSLSKSDSKRRSSIVKSKTTLQPHLNFSEKSFQLLTPIKEKAESSPSKKSLPSSPRNTSLRHSMVLRQAKPKSDNIF